MKIVCISDTHNQLDKVVESIPNGDVLLHAGDMTFMGEENEIKKFNSDIGRLPHGIKIAIAGNHDWLFERDNRLARSLCTNFVYLEDEEYILPNGLKVYGSPWQPEFCNWAFNLSRITGELTEKWAKIPEDTDILITHGPPHGILDMSRSGEQCGCQELRERIRGLKKLKLHVFGHIQCNTGKYYDGRVHYFNASTCDEQYRPVNPAMVIEL